MDAPRSTLQPHRGMSPATGLLAGSPSGASTCGSHELAAWTGCERLGSLRYGLRARRKSSTPWQIIGTLVHTCLAYHYAALLKDPPEWYRKVSIHDALTSAAEGQLDQVEKAKQVYLGWYQRYAAAGDPWTPVTVEQEYAAKIGELDPDGPFPELNDVVVTCKTDLIFESNNFLEYADHKCSGGNRSNGKLEAWKDDGEYRLTGQFFQNLHIIRNHYEKEGRYVLGARVQRLKRELPFDFDRPPRLRMPLQAYQIAARGIRMKAKRRLDVRKKLIDKGYVLPDISGNAAPIAIDEGWREQVIRVLTDATIDANFDACFGRYGPCDYADLCAADGRTIEDIQERQRLLLDVGFTWPGRPGADSLVQIGQIPWAA